MTFEMRKTVHAQLLSRKFGECLEHTVLEEEILGMIGEVGRCQVIKALVSMLRSLNFDMEILSFTPYHWPRKPLNFKSIIQSLPHGYSF